MGKKKRLMRAGRKNLSDQKSDPANSDVLLDLNFDGSKYDSSNAILLQSKRPEVKVAKVEVKKKKKLSKKQLKKLQCVVQRRHKKTGRGKILEEYSKHQVSSNELTAMMSISSIQTSGLKILCKRGRKRKRQTEGVDDVETTEPSSDDGDITSGDEKRDLKKNEKSFSSLSKEFTLSGVTPAVVHSTPSIEEAKEKIQHETVFIGVQRDPDIEEWRKTLPIFSEEQAIMDAVRYHDVTVICGETGSGKTTQIPQFLFEAGYARKKSICVTEPRRVAAMAMSRRVGYEMNLSSRVVSYHIRYEKNITNDTKIKFVTDGVLLREVQKDFLLSDYSVVVIDEAHERSVFSDILVGLLSRIVPLRAKKGNPLKLIIMSATLRVDDFVGNRKLFSQVPPVVKVDSRQFPVTIKFVKHTPENYMNAAFEKVCQVHRTQSPGGILVFVTGRNQVNALCKKLQAKFPSEPSRHEFDSKVVEEEQNIVKRSIKRTKVSESKPIFDLDDDADDEGHKWHEHSDSESDISEIDGDKVEENETLTCKEPLYCLPLFSQLPKHRQNAVFEDPPQGHRLVVVATNVAETSLTIPGIKYVIDTGKAKTKVYDKTTGVSAFIVTWSSKASAEQRAGRAGRTCPGICYRLYSSAIYSHDFPDFCDPEIILKPTDDLVIQMKSLDVTNILNFPFPTCPSIESLEASEKRLLMMEALEEVKTSITPDGKTCTRLTSLGKAMSCFPVSPRYSKMLAMTSRKLIPHVVAIISGLTVQEILMNTTLSGEDSMQKKWNGIRARWTAAGNERLLGDVMVILKAIGASEYMSAKNEFHNKIGLRHKAMEEVHKLRSQLLKEVCRVFCCDRSEFPTSMTPPSDSDALFLRQLCLAAFFDQVARRNPDLGKTSKHSYQVYVYIIVLLSHNFRNGQCVQVEDPVYIDQTSILKDDCPEYVVYQEIHEKDSKTFMRNVAAIDPEWLPLFAKGLCNLSEPLDDPPPFYDKHDDSVKCYVTGTYGPYCWPIPMTAIQFPAGHELHTKWFARLLVEGHIHSFFQKYASRLLVPPSLVIRPWAKHNPKTSAIINCLKRERVGTLATLNSKWISEPTYLLNEYLGWIPNSLHDEIKELWPPKI